MSVKSGLFQAASKILAKVEQDLINAIMNGINEKASSSATQLQKVKSLITTTYPNVPDKVYEAFALAIVDVTGASKVDSYKTDMNELVQQIYNQLQKGLDNREADIVIDGDKYHVKFTVFAEGGVFTAWADVSRNGTYLTKLTATNYGTEDGMKALAEYCAVLAELNADIWLDLIAYSAKEVFKEIGLEKIEIITPDKSNPTKVKKKEIEMQKVVNSVLSNGSKIINAMCEKKAAEELLKEIGKGTYDKLKSTLFEAASKKFSNFVKNKVPGGENIVKGADKLKKVIEKYEAYKKKFDEYSVMSQDERKNAFDLTQKAYEDFKSAYKELGSIDIFKGFVPVAEWPDWL